jgi:cysteine/glycine-rich protein
MAAGATWHKTCFTCGFLPEGEEDPHNGNGQGCGRVLPQNKMHLSCGIAYCNACFTRVFTSGAARGAILRKKAINIRQVHDNVEAEGSSEVQELDGFMAGSVFQEKEKKEVKIKNIVVGQGDKCPTCSKTVYKMEALIAIGQTWHKACFTCGGPGNVEDLGCKRSLPQDSFQQHNMLPYCKACFMKNFGKGGYKVSSGPSLPSNNVTIDTSSGLSFSEKAAAFKKTVHEGAEVDSPSRKGTGMKFIGGGGVKCPVCTKTVFKMEEVLAIGHSFHPSCFTCGALGDGSSKEGCGKVLTRDQYLDGQGRPFCKNCYNKVFSSKGQQPSA